MPGINSWEYSLQFWMLRKKRVRGGCGVAAGSSPLAGQIPVVVEIVQYQHIAETGWALSVDCPSALRRVRERVCEPGLILLSAG